MIKKLQFGAIWREYVSNVPAQAPVPSINTTSLHMKPASNCHLHLPAN